MISQKVLVESLEEHLLIPGQYRLWLILGWYLIMS
jgi:hypothetical protein